MPECPVCLDPFSWDHCVPMLLLCGHSVCSQCTPDLSEPLTCPLCRGVTPSAADLKKNHKLLPPKSEGTCGECKDQAAMFCTLCGELCKGCSVKIHAFRAMSSHTVVPYDEKASVSPMCADHGEEALLYCPVDSSVICSRCRMEAHKTHSGVTSLQEAAVKKTSDQQAVLEQINALDPVVAGIKVDHDFLLKGLATAREELEAYFQKAQQDLISQKQQVQLRLDEHEAKLSAEFAEKFRVCAELQATRERILKMYEGNKLQILEAPMIEMCARPEVEPCTMTFPLSLDNLPKLSVECVRQNVRVGHRLDVLDMADGKWRTAIVREVGIKNFKIGYDGWAEKWDEWIEVGSSNRYANFGLHTKGGDTSALAHHLARTAQST